ncbi:hypothetical protein [Georgfuchsia toluolica]|nr:hypothetical protein [Georgfuchsia toluolica]
MAKKEFFKLKYERSGNVWKYNVNDGHKTDTRLKRLSSLTRKDN